MFNLEEQVGEWRQDMAAALGGRPEVIDELESHLRAEVDQLVRSGKPPEQAWAEALNRLGPPGRLAEEFAKLRAPSWVPARVALLVSFAAAVLLASLLLTRLWSGAVRPLLAGHVFTVTAGYAAGFAVGALAAWATITRLALGWDAGREQAFRSAARALAIFSVAMTSSGVILGAVWAKQHLGRYWSWDLRETGGLAVLLWGCVLLMCVRRSRVSVAAMAVAVLGNAVVGLSWFGPPLVERQAAYGQISWMPGLLLGGFVAAQVLLACASLRRARLSHAEGAAEQRA